MKKLIRRTLIVVCLLPFLAGLSSGRSETSGEVYVIDFNDMVHGVSADFIIDGIKTANEADAELIIIVMQTPGGFSSSMEHIIQEILASKVPVVGFVSPAGSKAASAGFYILMACDVAVMAPGTRTGAATPIMLGGGGDSEDENFNTLMDKVKSDSRAFLRSLVRGRIRNPDVPIDETVQRAEAAIKKGSEAYTEQEALKYGLIDFNADSVEQILERLDGQRIRRFTLEGKEPEYTPVQTANVTIVDVEMDMREQFLSYLSNPMVAMLLGTLGLLGLYLEFTNPGLILPGAVGIICLILASISFQILTINWAGLLLMGVAVVLFIMEFNIPSFGLLTIGGVICLILGGLILFEGPIPELRLDLWEIVPFALAFAAISLLLLRLVIKAHFGHVSTGRQGLVGETGTVKGGKAFIHGEIWKIANPEGLAEGDSFTVGKVDGLQLEVKKS